MFYQNRLSTICTYLIKIANRLVFKKVKEKNPTHFKIIFNILKK